MASHGIKHFHGYVVKINPDSKADLSFRWAVMLYRTLCNYEGHPISFDNDLIKQNLLL